MFRQTSPGRYVPIEVDDRIPEQRILEQGTRILRTGAVTAWAALRWHGARFFDGAEYDGTRLPVPIVGDKLRPDPRIAASQEQLAPTEWCVVEGLACTTVQRALFDEIRRHRSWREAVVAAEMTVAAGLISVRLMTDYIAQRAAWAGVPFARKVIALAVEGLRSPQESRMRLVWIFDAGLDPPLCNRPRFDLDGRLLGVPDLFDPVAGLVGEYDGAAHKDGRRHQEMWPGRSSSATTGSSTSRSSVATSATGGSASTGCSAPGAGRSSCLPSRVRGR